MADVPSNLIPTRISQLPDAPVASEDALLLITYQGSTYKVRAGDLLQVAGVPTTRQVNAGTGLTGGGALSSNVTLSIANGGVGSTQLNTTGVAAGSYGSATEVPVFTVDANGRVTAATTIPVDASSGDVPDTRQVIAGTGLTGGGALSSDVTLNAALSNATPLVVDDTGSAGVSNEMARADHQHPAVDLSDQQQINGILPVDQGGTSRSLVMEAGAIIWSGADGLYVGPAGVAGQVLVSNGANEYYWANVPTDGDQPAHYVYIGPASGADAPPTYRLLVSDDLPTAIDSKTITGSTIDSTPIGATTPDTGSFTELTADQIDFDTTVSGITDAEGRVYWNSDDNAGTLNLGLTGNNVVLQVGEETLYRIKASAAITKGQAVMFTGAVGASAGLQGAPATGLTISTASYFMGIATENIALNGWGYVTHFGVVRGIDTTGGAEAWVDGQILYFDPSVAGGLTKTVPTAPNPKIQVAAVMNAAANGSMFVRPTVNPSLENLGDVESTTPTTNDLLQYTAGGYWTHTPNTSISVGEATNLAGGAANKIAYQTAADTTGFIDAPTTANTFLEWSGSDYQWSANPLGTVTSVDTTVPTGFTVSGTPITTSGTIAISFDTGYSLPTDASQTNWDTAYNERAQWDGGSTNLVAATGRTSLGLVIGTDVQAYDAGLTSIAGLPTIADKMLYTTGVDTWATTTVTSYARTILDDASASDARTTLGLGTAATRDAGSANGVAELDGGGTVPTSQLPAAVLGALKYQGTWNASTNTPTLASGTGTQGYYYVVSVAGTTNLDGITDWEVGDWAIYSGTAWQKIDNTDEVSSVNGYTGTVVLDYTDVGAPSTTGTNASGTWAIDISGNAATATSATSATTATTATQVSNTLTRGTYLTGSNFDGSAATTWAVDATSSNTASKVVARDASGNFSAGTITAALNGNATTATSATSATSATTATNIAGGAANRIAYNTGSGATSFVVAPTTANTYLEWSGSAFQWSANPLGSVTSVDVSGGTTGLTTSGGPITTNGTITLAGTLAVANGGTGATTAAGALTSLGAYPASNPNGYTTNTGTVTSVTGGSYLTGGTITSSGTLAVDATTTNTASKVVARDASGNFAAGTITAALSGNASTATTLQTARTINGVSFNGSANITVTANTTNTLTRGTYLTGSNFNGSAATTWAVDATSANTASKVVARDASGNFSANEITATKFVGMSGGTF